MVSRRSDSSIGSKKSPRWGFFEMTCWIVVAGKHHKRVIVYCYLTWTRCWGLLTGFEQRKKGVSRVDIDSIRKLWMINSDYLVWVSAGWMKQNMCASCRILHNPIVFRSLLWWGNMPSLLIGWASTRVYICGATVGWIFLRSYLDFSYVRTGSDDSIYDTSIIEVVDWGGGYSV